MRSVISVLRRVKSAIIPSPQNHHVPAGPVLHDLSIGDASEFRRRFQENLANCDWQPHPRYSVFTQYDQEFYLQYKAEFEYKYRCFYAVSKTIAPSVILELGTHAGSSADAYISATPTAKYFGFDIFGDGIRNDDGTVWKPFEVANQLMKERGFTYYELFKVDLRTLEQLPQQADFVVVDGAHDFENEYADLKLALTANPDFIFVDDSAGVEANEAVAKFLRDDVATRVDFTFVLDYVGGGVVIRLRQSQ